ncbi:MAG: hypothetical protein J0I32_09805 [Sphingobacteriales bacterium]|nr:hypothetical protein [Sphingobacteriales bacterium]OJW00290.1 MAG: hypothetical protein BGO52_04180 [Sphingobacteriales bacterium 44-61]
MKILIVDDSPSKLADVVTAIREISSGFEIESCSDCISAISKLENKFDLILLDLLLPLRTEDEPKKENGKYIINEIYRNVKLLPPTYILCLTQFDELIEDFHPIWRTVKYDPASIVWKQALKELLVYVSRQHSLDDRIIIEKIPTIYVEGWNDEKILHEALCLYHPDYNTKINIKSKKGAGVNWVTRQLIVWASSLPLGRDSSYVSCVGMYDNDQAGREGIEELNRIVRPSSAGATCIKTFKYTPGYAEHLKGLYKKGLKIPICVEEMFEPKYWSTAKSNGWLEDRVGVDMLLSDPSGWDKMKTSLGEHIRSLGLSEAESIYLKRPTEDGKEQFRKYLLGLSADERKDAFKCFKPLLKEILFYLLKKNP